MNNGLQGMLALFKQNPERFCCLFPMWGDSLLSLDNENLRGEDMITNEYENMKHETTNENGQPVEVKK